MRRKFDAACRQYEVKEAGLENLWTTDRTWPLGGLYFYDSASQTYSIPASATQYNHTVTICQSRTPIPAGTPVSMTLFFDSGRVEYGTEYPFWIGGCNYNFSTASGDAVPEINVECPESTDLAGVVLKSTSVTTHPVDFFCFFVPGTTVTETLRFRVMLVIGDTPADTFKPFGMDKYAWPDGLKSGLPSVKMLGKTEQVAEPSPLAPQEVKGNNATVRSCGKNLFNVESTHYIVNSEYLKNYRPRYENGIFYTGAQTGYDNGAMVCIPVKPGDTYTCSYEVVVGAPTNTSVMGFEDRNNDGLGTGHKYLIGSLLPSPFTFTIPEGIRYIGINPAFGNTRYEVGLRNVQLEHGSVATEYEPYFDGGEATAPNLMCAVDGSCQSTYDTQTGELVNWWWDKMVFDGSEDWDGASSSMNGVLTHCHFIVDALPENMYYNACWSNQSHPTKKGTDSGYDKMMQAGRNNSSLYVPGFDIWDTNLNKWSNVNNWKAHLAEHPLEVWVARNEPEITNIGAQPLTCPTCYGQIVQVAGDVPDCPMEVKYLSHGGNVK